MTTVMNPQERPETGFDVLASDESPGTVVNSDGIRILIADDDRSFRQYLRAMLEEQGYVVIESEDGMKAILRIINESPDLIILDLAMPTISGYRVSELLSSVPETRNIPFIIISGDKQAGPEQMVTLGACAVFRKPFNKEKLLNKIAEVLSHPILEIIEESSDASTDHSDVKGKSGEEPAKIGRQDAGSGPGPLTANAGSGQGREDLAETEQPPDQAEPGAAAALRNGSPDSAADLLRKAISVHPDNLANSGLLRLAESLIVKRFHARRDPFESVVPQLDSKLAGEITRFSLNPSEGFLISQIDGRTDLENLFHVSGMDRFRTCLLLEKLLEKGIVLMPDEEKP